MKGGPNGGPKGRERTKKKKRWEHVRWGGKVPHRVGTIVGVTTGRRNGKKVKRGTTSLSERSLFRKEKPAYIHMGSDVAGKGPRKGKVEKQGAGNKGAASPQDSKPLTNGGSARQGTGPANGEKSPGLTI